MESRSGHDKTTAIVLSGLIGLVLGGGIVWATYGMSYMNKEDMNSTSSQMTMDASSDGVTVGGAKMVKTKDIVDNAAGASNVTTLVDLVKKAELVETLKGEGPFTVFGPNNAAFAKLDAATVESLRKPENKAALQNILTYHVVAGTYTSADLKVMAQKGESLKTVQGEMLMPMMQDNMVVLEDAKGGVAEIETTDVISSNGVTHVIKSVLMPSK